MTVTYTSVLLSMLLCVFCVEECVCFSNGSVAFSCGSLLPAHHPHNASTSSPPVTLTTSSATYSPGGLITVTMQVMDSSMYFQGFMLQARSNKQNQAVWPVGKFSNIDVGTFTSLDCNNTKNSSVSQASASKKTKVQLTWEAPGDSSYGDVYFCAAVVKNFTTFWVNVNSNTLRLSTSSAAAVVSSSALLFISVLSVSAFH